MFTHTSRITKASLISFIYRYPEPSMATTVEELTPEEQGICMSYAG